jgi:hypothetical protein
VVGHCQKYIATQNARGGFAAGANFGFGTPARAAASPDFADPVN